MKLAFMGWLCTNPIRASDWLKLQKLNILLGECTACCTGSPTLWHSTPQQLNNVNIDCVIDCIPKYPTHIDKNEKMSKYSPFSVSPPVYKCI